ncbi:MULTISPECIES: hypothetical protein [unclassified Nocardia]|uniref:hypothetical protein n=1 Tax=unclassified Nocardia TaxID=2637762 RepID=UPI001CE3F9BE|nr:MULTISPECIES: hypothetical protein [unclassified Nocardia]
MRAIGVCYDTGFVHRGNTTHEPFDPDAVLRDMRAIHDDLHCDAVRITGGYPERLKRAAALAADVGLEVWICPFVNGVTQDELFEMVADIAEFAERLRVQGANVVLAVGSELSLFVDGFFPGDDFEQRAAALPTPAGRTAMAALPGPFNEFLARATAIARARFHGTLTYCCLPFEQVSWEMFDILATDAGYRSAALADRYPDLMRTFAAAGAKLGKPVAVTEFGCVTYRGSADRADKGAEVIQWDPDTATPLRLDGEYERDEEGQAAHLLEMLAILDESGIDTAFWYCFARPDLVHRDEPVLDLDLASGGLVKVFDSVGGAAKTWEPKLAFAAMANRPR